MPIRRASSHRWSAAVVALAALLTACTTTDEVPVQTELPVAFEDGVPEPSGPTVLTVTTTTGTHDWDIATLQRLPQHDLTILDPFVDEEHTYTGPLWADVLRACGVDLAAADTVELVALDDYVADIPTDAETLDGLLLAHEEDGQDIPIEDGGPIRLVFPPDNPAADNPNNWIWSVRTATVS